MIFVYIYIVKGEKYAQEMESHFLKNAKKPPHKLSSVTWHHGHEETKTNTLKHIDHNTFTPKHQQQETVGTMDRITEEVDDDDEDDGNEKSNHSHSAENTIEDTLEDVHKNGDNIKIIVNDGNDNIDGNNMKIYNDENNVTPRHHEDEDDDNDGSKPSNVDRINTMESDLTISNDSNVNNDTNSNETKNLVND